ncbi:hypothetical protein [Planomonospora parontospora]|uniref:hypothetical protein n=1 Tax=Planomonospora parontospora TaxID=58119 RepID=UPI0016718757|nr:hypothetical protein [Planomonospora parontospora]
MKDAEAQRLRGILSQGRLGEYEALCGGQTIAALRLHCWNTQISAAFYPSLQYLELAVRSVLDREMHALFGTDAWWDEPAANLHFGAQQKIRDLKAQLRRQGVPATAQQIVSELSFGFWVSLLGPGNNYDQRLWRTGLYRAFPGYRGGRRDLHRQLDYLRVLRNKIAHHGPIHHRHLQADHEAILVLLGYIDVELADWVRRYSQVDAILTQRPHP